MIGVSYSGLFAEAHRVNALRRFDPLVRSLRVLRVYHTKIFEAVLDLGHDRVALEKADALDLDRRDCTE